MKLKFAQHAVDEMARGKRDWLAWRDKNPDLFEEELAGAFEQLKAMPTLGSPTDIISKGKFVGCMQMPKTQYQVYYREEPPGAVLVLAVLGGKRGPKPKVK